MYVYDMGRLFSKGFAYQPDRKKKFWDTFYLIRWMSNIRRCIVYLKYLWNQFEVIFLD